MSHDKTTADRNEADERVADLVGFTAASPEEDDIDRESETARDLLTRVGSALSRRSFLSNTMKAGAGVGALSLAGTGVTAASAQQSSYALGEDKDGKNDDITDIDVLNFALTLEKLEATFYTRGQKMFSECEVESSDAAKRLGKELQSSTYEYFNLIRDHEQAHVKRITNVINNLGGEPVSGLEFEFPFETVQEYFVLAQTFENLGVSAYDGAIALIEDPDLQTAGATIATVEARHASYLNILNQDVPFPRAFDQPKTMDEVLAAADQFIIEQ